MEITKQQLIDMWLLYTENKATDPDSFSYLPEIEMFSIRINDKISISVDKNTKEIALFFADVIRYKVFVLDQIECDALLLSWETGLNKSSKYQKDKHIAECLHEFEILLLQSHIS